MGGLTRSERRRLRKDRLAAGYWIEHDATMIVLHRPDGSVVAAFNPMGADPEEIAAEAWGDAAGGA